jgi:hypothetical protein
MKRLDRMPATRPTGGCDEAHPLRPPVALRTFLLLLVLCAPSLRAQQRIPAPAIADSLWQIVRECSGAPIQPGGDLGDLIWLVDSVSARDRFHGSAATWSPPDTIAFDLDLDYNAHPWVIAHELLHHLERGPPGPVVHPFNPFYFPCRLMPLQHPRLPG